MRVVKPNQLSVLFRPYDFKNKYRLGVTGLILFPFAEPRYPMTESALWMLVGELLPGMTLDDSMPKAQGEILIRGNAYAPGGEPKKVVRVAVELEGKPLKELAVVGNRVWKNGVPSEPEPFTSMAITWENAFGGEGFKKNPLGKGHKAKDGAPLPNIEDRRTLVTSPSQKPEPVGFLPYDVTWPQRLEKAGTYNKKWLDEYYPGFATDMDWSFFNVAPPDQRVAGFFRGDEDLVLKNMHPAHPELRCKLPEVQLTCFMRRKRKSGDEVQSMVPMTLDTVWLFPDAAHGIVVFHGSAPIREDDAADVAVLYMACEDLGQPKALEHYQAVLERRLDKENGAIAALDDKPLMPALRGAMKEPPAPYDDLTELTTTDRLAYHNLKRKQTREVESARALLVQYGLDPDKHGPKHVDDFDENLSLEETLARADQIDAELAREAELAEERRQAREPALRALCEQAGIDFDEIKREWMGPGNGGPPPLMADVQLARLQNLAEEGRAAGCDVSEIDDYLADPAFIERLHDQDRAKMEAYRMGAQLQEEPDLRIEAESTRLRAELCAAHQRGESLKGRNLTGANLAGIELVGADLEEALMERCNLSQANLSGATLSRAVLARANLTGARLDGCKLDRANLAKAEAKGTSFVDAILDETILHDTQFVGATLDGASLERAMLQATKLERCSMKRIRATGIMLEDLDLQECSFAQAQLADATFIQCTLDRVDFTEADLQSATLFGCRGTRSIFERANAKSLRVVEGTELRECDFRHADLEASCFRGAKLTGSDFSDATAPLVDFSECDMKHSRLYHLKAKQGRFIRTDLTGATLTGADLYEALLSKAILHGADLRGANLYQADMAMAVGDENTKLDSAMVIRVRSKPRWEDKIQDLD